MRSHSPLVPTIVAVVMAVAGSAADQPTVQENLHVYDSDRTPALGEAALVFAEEQGIRAEVVGASPGRKREEAMRAADVVFSPSAFMMADLVRDGEIQIDGSSITPLYWRPSILLVRPGNPKGVRDVPDLLRPDVRVMVVGRSARTGLWQDEVGPEVDATTIGALERNVAVFADNGVEAARVWAADDGIDAMLTWSYWQMPPTDQVALVAIGVDNLIYRRSVVALTERGKNDPRARRLMEFLVSEEGAAVFKSWNWATPPSSPDVVMLGELEHVYLPVPFDHRGHAKMAEMARGCVTCHHHAPQATRLSPCKTCHDASGDNASMSRPSLKGAYHRQCLNCHREWSDPADETSCTACHISKVAGPEGGVVRTPTKYDLLGTMHPPIPEPESEIYRVDSDQAAGSRVIFRHREHIHRFGLTCAECHHEQNCTHCHSEDRGPVHPRTPAEHHRPCSRCHADDMKGDKKSAAGCKRCHWEEGQPKPEEFDHADTGWPLGRFHELAGCRDCHRQTPFVKLDRDCDSCHSRWDAVTFDHLTTGQALDENHAQLDCLDCHVERKFDRAPSCDKCHSPERDGITFPGKRPGSTVSPENAKPSHGPSPQ